MMTFGYPMNRLNHPESYRCATSNILLHHYQHIIRISKRGAISPATTSQLRRPTSPTRSSSRLGGGNVRRERILPSQIINIIISRLSAAGDEDLADSELTVTVGVEPFEFGFDQPESAWFDLTHPHQLECYEFGEVNRSLYIECTSYMQTMIETATATPNEIRYVQHDKP